MAKEIEELRREIDGIDDRIVELLNRRARMSVEMGALKNHRGVFDPARERRVMERLQAQVQAPLGSELLGEIYESIFSFSRGLQARRNVAYFGPAGSYTHQAAMSVFRFDAELEALPTIEGVIQEVIAARADLGVVPVENSTEGMINQTLDLMGLSRLSIAREIMLPIRHCLLSRAGLEGVEEICSHPQALAQCRAWIRNHLPGARLTATTSTSEAARAAAGREGCAAIASREAAGIYALDILAEGINDVPDNITRFWVVGRDSAAVTGRAKTSIIITLQNVPGSLYQAIGIFAGQGINLTNIKSRPSHTGPWEYRFFIDFEGRLADDHVRAAMDELRACTSEITVLGSYPEGKTNQ